MKDIKELSEKIALENEIFSKMSKAEKRVAIAKDCLERIELGQLSPQMKIFCEFPASSYVDKDDSLEKLINSGDEDTICTVCAKGGLFISYVGRVNKVTVFGMGGNYITSANHVKLLEIFSAKQLSLIELAYENYQFLDVDSKMNKIYHSRNSRQDAEDFHYKHNNATNRLKAICKNIIKNKGTFKP